MVGSSTWHCRTSEKGEVPSCDKSKRYLYVTQPHPLRLRTLGHGWHPQRSQGDVLNLTNGREQSQKNRRLIRQRSQGLSWYEETVWFLSRQRLRLDLLEQRDTGDSCNCPPPNRQISPIEGWMESHKSYRHLWTVLTTTDRCPLLLLRRSRPQSRERS